MAAETSSSGSLVRWALPVVLFVAIVGAIAWVSQNLPKGAISKVDQPTTTVDPDKKSSTLRFAATRAVWDENDPEYLKEFETGTEGHFDFPFFNPNATPIALGFAQSSCDCSQLKVAVFGPELAAPFANMPSTNPVAFPKDPTWTVLTVNEKDGVEIPAGGGGVARMQWNGRKGAGQRLKLNIKMWMQPAGKPDERTFENLEVPIVMAEPLRFFPDRLALGAIGSGGSAEGEFFAWSPTREKLDLKIDASKLPPNMEATITRLEGPAAKSMEERMREEKRNTRARSAFRIVVKISEQKNGKQFEQGPLRREISFLSADIPFELQSPTVTANIRGDIDVGLPEDNGAISLKTFAAKNGIRKTIPVWHDGSDELTIESVYPMVLEVKLTKSAKESTPARTKWSLDINVPPGAWYGPFQDDAVIVLRTGTAPPRRIRIPIVGNAGQG